MALSSKVIPDSVRLFDHISRSLPIRNRPGMASVIKASNWSKPMKQPCRGSPCLRRPQIVPSQTKSFNGRTVESFLEDATEEDLEAAYIKCSAKTRELDTDRRLSLSLRKLLPAPCQISRQERYQSVPSMHQFLKMLPTDFVRASSSGPPNQPPRMLTKKTLRQHTQIAVQRLEARHWQALVVKLEETADNTIAKQVLHQADRWIMQSQTSRPLRRNAGRKLASSVSQSKFRRVQYRRV